MNNKLAVTLKPYSPVQYPYKKLKICRKCNHFTVLGEQICMFCHKSALQPVEKRAAVLTQRKCWFIRILLVVLIGVGLPFSTSPLQTGLLLVCGIALLSLIWTIQVRLTPALERIQLKKMFHQHAYSLVSGLKTDHQAAIAMFHQGDKPRTYEMLREIGSLVQTDQMRVEQIMLLQTFRLRKDMDLMIEPLLMESFNADLVDYIGELAKIRRDLLKENTFRYVLQYESQILKLQGGKSIIAGVAGAAVRKKRYLVLYPYLLISYARLLPKDRFLRLYRIVQNDPIFKSRPLYDEVMRVYEEKYKWDQDFQNG
ncbi:hypothetical protein I6N90_11315 [Paenibacillus sp. GSMTC-2017]|uniref:hypothetical protein n=1 Tax=Paenibacillus sp. GSMTC-2017 TaxID=2794350 RepID=UPI0018D8304A|nr:hypothetical protein [Paenibacillus sp. GSMTC-2017]MBH5318397.1 hypothetical protein [Paenibacillus sp. GSMTC-2017]